MSSGSKDGSSCTRRTFLKLGAVSAGALAIGCWLPDPDVCAGSIPQEGGGFRPNAWVRVGSDEEVTVSVGKPELGQGVLTAMGMLVAEELEADWSRVRVVRLPLDEGTSRAIPGPWRTSRSDGVRLAWEPLRRAGAAAREMLVAAAAARWGVAVESCVAREGYVVHPASDRRWSYGELAAEAARQAVSHAPRLKEPQEFRRLGVPTRRVDAPEKVDGSAVFGFDVHLPGLLTAVVARCPVPGGRLGTCNDRGATAVRGVRAVVPISAGVAVVAESFWSAKVGRDALRLTWDSGSRGALDNSVVEATYRRAAQGDAVTVADVGEVETVLAKGDRGIAASYWAPFLAHAPLEPMNCTADVRADSCTLWVPTQSPTGAREEAARITGLPVRCVEVHATFSGGGFGRRLKQDFVAEAVEVSKALGAPVKVLWTRDDDLRHDFYRPAVYHRLAACLTPDGLPLAWRHRIVGPPVTRPGGPASPLGEVDVPSGRGVRYLPYAVPHARLEIATVQPALPVGAWRSVGQSHGVFAVESFLDEVAAAGGWDALALRLRLLETSPSPLRTVLQVAAREAGWGSPLPAGRGRGLAVHAMAASFVAQVAEVSVSARGAIQVHRVVCAVDCGIPVNPSGVEAQLQGGILFGLTAALRGEITVSGGHVQQGSFADYPILKLSEAPSVEVHLVKSQRPPGGVGEIGVPAVAPAVANAVFAACGRRLRRLPLRLDGPPEP